MLDWILMQAGNPKFLLQLVIVAATVAAVITAGAPLLNEDPLGKRMKAVALERERLRGRAREEFSERPRNQNLRQAPKPFMKQVVDSLNLTQWLSVGDSKLFLARAGYRGPQAEIALLFFRLVTPPVFALAAVLYVFVFRLVAVTPMIGTGIVVLALYIGLKAPEIFINNAIEKRKESIRSAFPDALDLLLICVESGISIESAFQRVGQEIGQQSIALAEEMTLTMAELSYLPDRQQAYENFGERINLDAVRQIVMVLVQAERVGTPLASALRTVSQETRARRLLEAEKKAAGLPPKLTVPMMVFFLPCIFAVLLTPAIIQITQQLK
jgi:tight adherence protein C